ncbi:MAG: polysaccharide biosynthesis C-terminal domain-containing protein [Oscillospiraceae bacterium]
MKRGKKLVINTFILTATSIFIRSVGLVFQVYLSKTMGAAGIGLFILTVTVSLFAITFAISGARFAVTRLVSEELGVGNGAGVIRAMRCGVVYAAIFGTASLFLLYFGSGIISRVILSDDRALLPLRILAFAMPFLSISSVFSGYFTAVGRITRSSLAQIIEQMVQIVFVVFVFMRTDNRDIEFTCSVIMLGTVIGDVVSAFLLLAFYISDRRRYLGGNGKTAGIIPRMLDIAIPLALSAYARTTLLSLQNLLVPKGLKKFGSSSDKALADYGTIQGMVFPVITYPSSLFTALSELLVPELTEVQVRGDREAMSEIVSRILRICLIFSLGVMGILFAFSGELGEVLYQNADVGRYIRIFALLMPVMYMDTVTDGMLRGLGQHMYSMKYNIIDALISAALVFVLVPRFAVAGYIFVLYFSEIFNFFLSIHRLHKVSPIVPGVGQIFRSVFSIFAAINVALLLSRQIDAFILTGAIRLVVRILLSAVFYILMLFIFKGINLRRSGGMKSVFAHTDEN